MRVEHSLHSMNMTNFDTFLKKKAVNKRHSSLLPNTIRALLCGPSNCGKTNVIFNLLFEPNGLKFANVYIFSKSLHQPKYKFLEKILENSDVGYYPFTDNEFVIPPNEAEPNSIMIFDDIACEKHNNIRAYFTMGRHNNIDSFYLGQSYSNIPKHLIRDNANLLIVFKQDDLNLRHIYKDHVNTDVSFDEFRNICAIAWENKHGFIVIDKDSEKDTGRYRIGFDRFIKDI